MWNEEKDAEWGKEVKQMVMTSFAKAEKVLKPSPAELFNEVYADMPASIRKQEEEMKAHVKAYADKYPIEHYDKW